MAENCSVLDDRNNGLLIRQGRMRYSSRIRGKISHGKGINLVVSIPSCLPRIERHPATYGSSQCGRARIATPRGKTIRRNAWNAMELWSRVELRMGPSPAFRRRLWGSKNGAKAWYQSGSFYRMIRPGKRARPRHVLAVLRRPEKRCTVLLGPAGMLFPGRLVFREMWIVNVNPSPG